MPRDNYYLPTRRLVSQDDASITERANVPRSKFIGSWTRKTAFDAGYLVPIMVDEVLPGDHLSYNVTAYIRMQTPLFPIFDNQRIDTFFFFVPARLTWTNWRQFMGEQLIPDASIAYTIPQIIGSLAGDAVGSLFDHMGIPVAGQIAAGSNINFSALPFRAYNLIYTHWFRDQNIISSLSLHTGDGPDPVASYALVRRAKAHDYFTSALPWPQKFTAPGLPLAGTAPIIGLGGIGNPAIAGPQAVLETAGADNYAFFVRPETAFTLAIESLASGQIQVFADLAQASAISINTLRTAWLVQQLQERDARGGTRYVELIKSHFGVTNPDFRLQRPEYIGGGQSPLQLTPVAQTAPTAELPVGALGAAATAFGQHRASYAATEHGYIIGLINVRSELSYQQGLHKLYSRLTRYDFYWPSLSGLGEQAILRKEIYGTGFDLEDDLIFGYQERWQEYRTRYSDVTGFMRSTAIGTLDNWHLAQRFLTAPTLSPTFINDTPDMTRILAAGALADGQQYLADIMFERTAVRPIPQFGTPVTLGRF